MQSIEVVGPDGGLHVFKAGTSDEEINERLYKHYGAQQAETTATASAVVQSAQVTAKPENEQVTAKPENEDGLWGFGRLDANTTTIERRSAGERFVDNMEDSWETSWMAEGFRAGYQRAGENQQRRAAGRYKDMEHYSGINPMNTLGEGWGRLRGMFGVDVVAKSRDDLAEEKARRASFEKINAEGDSFLRYWREGDVAGFALHSVASLGGALTGSAPDPTNLIGGPGKGLLARAAFQGIVAGGTDVVAQMDGMTSGLEEEFSKERLIATAALGVAFQVTMDVSGKGVSNVRDRLFRQNEADIKTELDAFDEVHGTPDVQSAEPGNGYESARTVVIDGEEVILRGEGSPIDQVEGGVQPSDYVENGRVWRAKPPVWSVPETPEQAQVAAVVNETAPASFDDAVNPTRWVDPLSAAGKTWHEGNVLVQEDGTPITLYHGNYGNPFESYDPAYKGHGAGGDDTELGMFLTTEKRTALSYSGNHLTAKGKNALSEVVTSYQSQPEVQQKLQTALGMEVPTRVLEAMIRHQYTHYEYSEFLHDAVASGRAASFTEAQDWAQKALEPLREELDTVLEQLRSVENDTSLYTKGLNHSHTWLGEFQVVMKNPLRVSNGGQGYDEASYVQWGAEAREGGYDGLIISDTIDGGGATGDVYIALDPSTVRPLRPNARLTTLLEEPEADVQWQALPQQVRDEFMADESALLAQKLTQALNLQGTVSKNALGAASVHFDDIAQARQAADAFAAYTGKDVTLSGRDFQSGLPEVEATWLELPANITPTQRNIIKRAFPDAVVNNREVSIPQKTGDVGKRLGELLPELDFDLYNTMGYAHVSKAKGNNPNDNPHTSDGSDEVGASLYGTIFDEFRAAQTESLQRLYAFHGVGEPDPVKRRDAAYPADEAEPSVQVTEGPPVEGSTQSERASRPRPRQINGWGDVNFREMHSNPRSKEAENYKSVLMKAIKPEAVSEFMDFLDNPFPDVRGRPHINKDWINWEAFKGKPDELVQLGDALGKVFQDAYKAAGVTPKQSHAELKKYANDMGYSMSEVMSLGKDVQDLTARSYVLRDLFNGAADHLNTKMTELRALRSTGFVTPDQVKELTELIELTTVLGATDRRVAQEIGRALKARQIMSKPKFGADQMEDMMKYLSNTLSDKGEPMDTKKVFELVDSLSDAYAKGGSGGLNKRLRAMREWGFWDYLGYAVVANLLSGLPTHFKNMLGGPMQATLDLASRAVAGGVVAPARHLILKARGKDLSNIEHVKMREVLAYAQGNINASSEALMLAFEGYKKGASVTQGNSSVLTDTNFVPFQMNKARYEKWQADGFSWRNWGDMAGVAYFEIARTLGFRPSVAADEFNKAMARRGELHALAYRRAAEASARAGGDKAIFDATFKAILETPSDTAMIEAKVALETEAFAIDGTYDPTSVEFKYQQMIKNMDVSALAEAQADLVTFQESGEMVEAIQSLLRRAPFFKHFSANFVRTPVQILKAVMRDYNPVGALVIVPLEATTAKGRARHKAFLNALANEASDFQGGGAAAERVIARQLMGAAVMGIMWGFWADGQIIGQDVPEGEEFAGVKPYSVKLPGVGWTQFTGYSPFGDLMGMVADVGRILEVKETTSDQDFAILGALAVAIRNNVVNKSFFTGMYDMMEMIGGGSTQNPNNTQSVEDQIARSAISIAAGRLIPASGMLRRIAQEQDPVVRDARSFIETVTAHLPGRSQTLAAKRDFMGRPIIRSAGERGVAQVATVSEVKTNPLDVRLHVLANTPGIDMKISAVPRKIDGKELEPHEYSRLIEIQGQLTFDREGLNMEQSLTKAASDPEFLAMTDYQQAAWIKKTVSDFRKAGREIAFDPDSPHYIASFVERTGKVRLEAYAQERGISLDEAFRKRGQRIGLRDMSQWNQAMEEME